MVSWSTIQSLLIFFGPLLLPKAIGFVRSIRSRPTNLPPKPLTPSTRFILNLLTTSAILALLSSLAYFQEENVIKLTSSRLLQTPTEVIARRLVRYRNGGRNVGDETAAGGAGASGGLSPYDTQLLDLLKTRDGRLLYAMYGPTPLVECVWCSVSEPMSYLYYMIPKIAWPHLLHTAILGIATSGIFGGGSISSLGSLSGGSGGGKSEGKEWRIHATVAGLVLALGEFVGYWTHDVLAPVSNGGGGGGRDGAGSDFHWQVLMYRGIAIAITDAVLGYMIYLSSTGRMVGADGGVTDAERIERVTRVLETTLGSARSGSFVHGVVVEDGRLRERFGTHWKSRAEEVKTVMEDEEVVEVVGKAGEGVDMVRMGKEAGDFAEMLTQRVAFVKDES